MSAINAIPKPIRNLFSPRNGYSVGRSGLAEVSDLGYNDGGRCFDICDDWNVSGSIRRYILSPLARRIGARLLARDDVAKILIEEWSAARDRDGWPIGRYVIMPNHVHFSCRPDYEAKTLPEFVGAWKSWTSRRINKLLRSQSATAVLFPVGPPSDEGFPIRPPVVSENPTDAL